MHTSNSREVLTRLRDDILAILEERGLHVPLNVMQDWSVSDALVALLRVESRSIPPRRRRVELSPTLTARKLEAVSRRGLSRVRAEFESGAELTPRLSRHCFKASFNDFLFNNFTMHHLHLGEADGAWDKTQAHRMCEGTKELLFCIVQPDEAYFLDIQDHSVFESASKTEALLRILTQNRPCLLDDYLVHGFESEQTFEESFRAARAGFTTLFAIDGLCFTTGGTAMDGKVTNGKRAACTSSEVLMASDRILTRIVTLTSYIGENASALATFIASNSNVEVKEFNLRAIHVGDTILMEEESSGVQFCYDGRLAFRCTKDAPYVLLPTAAPQREPPLPANQT